MSAKRKPRCWYVNDPADGLSRFDTRAEAKAKAEEIMEDERDRAPEGWREDIEELEWGEIIVHGRATLISEKPASPGKDYDVEADYQLREPRSKR